MSPSIVLGLLEESERLGVCELRLKPVAADVARQREALDAVVAVGHVDQVGRLELHGQVCSCRSVGTFCYDGRAIILVECAAVHQFLDLSCGLEVELLASSLSRAELRIVVLVLVALCYSRLQTAHIACPFEVGQQLVGRGQQSPVGVGAELQRARLRLDELRLVGSRLVGHVVALKVGVGDVDVRTRRMQQERLPVGSVAGEHLVDGIRRAVALSTLCVVDIQRVDDALVVEGRLVGIGGGVFGIGVLGVL